MIILKYFILSGLKQGLQTVGTYSPLMKDFPLEQLLSATELDKIRDALVSIFTHMRKIKLSQYPIQRCLRLIEAISRDLMSQILKVLGTRKLMLMNYDEFEKVYNKKLYNIIANSLISLMNQFYHLSGLKLMMLN